MSPKNKPSILFVFILLLWTGFATVAGAQEPEANPKKNFLIKFYQNHLSAADGSRCPMTPSCSEYAARAMQKHGPVLGWVMACDRLVRCGRDEVRISPHIRKNGYDYVSDPVGSNDFWWFDPPPTKEETSQ